MRRARKSINQINVVPYIDVMLVLLIIFMVTAPLITPGEIALPTVGSTLPTAPSAPLQVKVDPNGALSLREGASTKPMTADALVKFIKQRQDTTPNQPQPVVILAAGNTQYQKVIDLIDLLQKNGVKKVGLLAQQQQK